MPEKKRKTKYQSRKNSKIIKLKNGKKTTNTMKRNIDNESENISQLRTCARYPVFFLTFVAFFSSFQINYAHAMSLAIVFGIYNMLHRLATNISHKYIVR